MSRRVLPTPENINKELAMEPHVETSEKSQTRARRDLPVPSKQKEVPESVDTKAEVDPSTFVKELSERATRGEEIKPDEIQRFQNMMTGIQRNPNQAQNVRNMLEGDELMEKMLQQMSGKRNAHGNQQPSRKKVLKAQKNAKKMMKTTTNEQKTSVPIKAIRITRSRQVKLVTLNTGNEVTEAMTALSSMDETTVYQWGEELIIITKPKCGHMRNKLIESIFNRDSMFGDEIIVLRLGKDTSIDEVKQLSKTSTKATPYVPPEPEFEPEVEQKVEDDSEVPELVSVDEKVQEFREKLANMSPEDISHVSERVSSILDDNPHQSVEQ